MDRKRSLWLDNVVDTKSPRSREDQHDEEVDSLLGPTAPVHPDRRRWFRSGAFIVILLQSIIILALLWLARHNAHDTIWSPAQDVVSYHTLTSIPYFDNRSPYLGTDAAFIDKMWEDLYDDGLISVLSRDEASHLHNETRAAPKAPDMFLVQLQVFHDLHCLNLIRKWAYMDVYLDQAVWVNGKIDHNRTNALHVDHCIDALRQSIMCTGDVTPRKFAPHENERPYYVYPSIYVTQTCRNFDAIRDWASDRRVVEWMMSFDEEWERTRFDVSLP